MSHIAPKFSISSGKAGDNSPTIPKRYREPSPPSRRKYGSIDRQSPSLHEETDERYRLRDVGRCSDELSSRWEV